MGCRELWFLLNLDSRQNALDLWGRLQCFHVVGPADPLNERLIDSLREPRLPLAYDELLTQGRPSARQHGLLGKLPVEMLGMIFSELPSRDALCLAVTCKLLLAVGKRRLTQTLSDRHASWRGDRLIYLGESSFGRESLPAGLLTDAEWDEVVQDSIVEPPADERGNVYEGGAHGENVDDYEGDDSEDEDAHVDFDDSDESDDDDDFDAPRLVSFAAEHYEAGFLCDAPFNDRERGGNALPPLISAIQAQTQTCPRTSENDSAPAPSSVGANDVRNLEALWGVRYETSDSVQVVCNLSKGEYIRADGFTLTPYPVDLGQALLARITWSTSVSGVAMRGKKAFFKELTQGPWAGDRFVVTTIDALPALEPGPGLEGGLEWRDTTAGVDRLLSHLFNRNFG